MPTPRTTKTRLTTSCPGSVADALTTEEEAAWANGGVAARVRREASCATRVRRRGGLPDAVQADGAASSSAHLQVCGVTGCGEVPGERRGKLAAATSSRRSAGGRAAGQRRGGPGPRQRWRGRPALQRGDAVALAPVVVARGALGYQRGGDMAQVRLLPGVDATASHGRPLRTRGGGDQSPAVHVSGCPALEQHGPRDARVGSRRAALGLSSPEAGLFSAGGSLEAGAGWPRARATRQRCSRLCDEAAHGAKRASGSPDGGRR